MGEYFRRFWQPVALSRELPAPDCAPRRVQVMGENLLLFRDTDGQVGLIEPRCPHRGADLFYGRNEACGIRCVYHGWKFDVTGRCLERPNMPAKDPYRDRIRIKAYPTSEFGDLVWAYMGPEGASAKVPQLEFGVVPATHRYVTKKLQRCNWAQALEGAIDTAHTSFLHMPAPTIRHDGERLLIPADQKRLGWIRDDTSPRLTVVEHAAGFVVGGARNAGDKEIYWRVAQFLLPSHSSTPAAFPGENYYGYTWVPITDEACWMYTYVWNPEQPISAEDRQRFDAGYNVISAVDSEFVPLRNKSNEYMLDREEQRNVSYTGVRGVAEQDTMIQESLGPIADRTQEHLTVTDAAIVRFRQIMLAGAKSLAEGTEPSAPGRPLDYRTRSGGWVADSSVPFEEVMNQRFGDPVGRVA
ncbi:MAG: Rieske 2Fe-2S domain-containing protein [Burkholderiales bacterium]